MSCTENYLGHELPWTLPREFSDFDTFSQIDWLNEQYADHPVHPNPPIRTEDGFKQTAERRLRLIAPSVLSSNVRLLEIGCGTGHFAEVSSPRVAHYVGVDIERYSNWDDVRKECPNATFLVADLSHKCPFPERAFDLIVSWVVWEHLEHPRAMLQMARRLLRPGGHFVFKANVYTSAIASHLYRDLFFPWPHLLFSEDELIQYVKHKWIERGRTSAEVRQEDEFPEPCLYVNKLTLPHYLEYFRTEKWHLLSLRRTSRPIDESFYKAFEKELGRYPKSDLALDFFTAVLRKPRVEQAYRLKETFGRAIDKLFSSV